jgi:hypothetical protein
LIVIPRTVKIDIKKFYHPAKNSLRMELPNELLKRVHARSSRLENSRFPYKLWQLLSWAGKDRARLDVCGCCWRTNDEFLIRKDILHKKMEIKANTLNVNLKACGFIIEKIEAGICHVKHPSFSASAVAQDFEVIRNARCNRDIARGFSADAALWPLLEDIQLYLGADTMASRLHQFKHEVIKEWRALCHDKFLFANSVPETLQMLANHLESIHARSALDTSILQQIFISRRENVIDIFDFAVLLARFGPLRSLANKLGQ